MCVSDGAWMKVLCGFMSKFVHAHGIISGCLFIYVCYQIYTVMHPRTGHVSARL